MDPLHQFEVYTYIPLSFLGIDVSFTNASLFMILSVALFCVLANFATKSTNLIPSRLQCIFEKAYLFIQSVIQSCAGRDGLVYFPYILGLFIFVFFSNTIGLLPGSFTTTSQLAVTGTLSLVVFVSVTVIGFMKHGLKFLKIFVPEGVPLYIMPILVPIEIISYLVRPISLSVRLFANMVSGHVLLKVFAFFAVMIAQTKFLPLALVPIFIHVGMTFFELAVAFLQAYVFTILSCIYLNDALHTHH